MLIQQKHSYTNEMCFFINAHFIYIKLTFILLSVKLETSDRVSLLGCKNYRFSVSKKYCNANIDRYCPHLPCKFWHIELEVVKGTIEKSGVKVREKEKGRRKIKMRREREDRGRKIKMNTERKRRAAAKLWVGLSITTSTT